MVGCFGVASLCFRVTDRTRKSNRNRHIHMTYLSLQLVTQERNWTELQPDLLRVIATRLEVVDNIRIRAVCTSWASALKDFHQVAPQFPWVLLRLGKDAICFFSSLDYKYFHIPIDSKIYNDCLLGSRDGWLLMATLSKVPKKIYMFNPLTKAGVNYPAISTIPAAKLYIRQVRLTASPSSTSGYVAVMSYGDFSEGLAFAISGDQSWVSLPYHSTDNNHRDFEDAVYHEGKITSIDSFGNFNIFKLEGGPSLEASMIKTHLLDIAFDGISLVSTPFGNLLVVRRFIHPIDFHITKYDSAAESWTEIKDLGETSIFLDKQKSMALSSRDIPGLKGNCIYYAFRYKESAEGITSNKVGVFDIAKGICKEYFPTETHSNCIGTVSPLWFVPSL